ncbi:MAG: putative peptidoglycan biosynthesis protein MurJ [Deltaproteobacteria bacterium ADurb.BinA179]|jgi:putative peptidoglycan lipid II flippase|nr:murein biosynthesis integral membrane protein MurJ [Deltaproteobacteria bacterium]MDI9543693.1 murein biosynthesis integral membrane protein MurJ [Pseudomonadota bacterium]NLW66645.1 murein biosynthesis integral membrane protein MurJ [Bacteriovoracaceae bacterium]OPZ29418.1 MAG: putative peptidoglycan biosynthesis protein MurJ [Deltaproteobacteria bacterium ADurb.BinA179]HRR20171.1 murein biosynthesis integral membrane protein MurJ [Desulfomonilia bacterium]
MKKSTKRKIAAVGGLTGISRILGFVRDMVMAWLLGAGFLADAFIVAFRIPNLLRRFMAEGAVSVAFVPVFVEAREKDGLKRAVDLTHGVFTLLFFSLTGLVIVGEIIAPFIVGIIAPGFLGGEIFDVTVHLTRIMFPFILLIGIGALLMGVLNSLGHFTAPAGAPILLNVFMIGMPIVFHVLVPVFASPADAFAWGVILGGAAQILLQIPPLWRRGVSLKITGDFFHPRLRQVLKLMGVAAVGASVYQLNVFVGTLLASLLSTGSVSYLYYANRIVELPLGLFAFAVSNVMLPSMSAAYARTDTGSLSSLTGESLTAVLLFTIPATIGIMVLAEPIFAVLFMRGAFGPDDVAASAQALRMYALGLCAVGVSRVLTQALYAMQKANEVVKTAWISLAVNIVFSAGLMSFLGHAGIALASSISVTVQMVLLYRALAAQGITLAPVIWATVGKMVGAVAVMGCGLFWFVRMDFWMGGLSLMSLSLLFSSIVFGAAVYFALLWVMGMRSFLR